EGERIVFDQGLQWLDGRSCEQWAAGPTRAAGAPSADDPALSDLQIPPVGEPGMFEDHRVNYTIEITCDGQPLARLLQVDERVLVLTAAGGAAYSIFERQ